MEGVTKRTVLAAHFALLGVAVIYGASFLIAKNAMQGAIPPRAFIQFRVTGAALLFWLLAPVSGEDRIGKIPRKDLLRLLVCAAFGVTANQLFFFEGLKITTPVNASIMMVSGPIAVLLVGAPVSYTHLTLPTIYSV